jgi:hypothetical protein
LLNRCHRGSELPIIIITILRSNLLASPAFRGTRFTEKEFEMGISKANDGEPTNGDWRELALRVQQEKDPQKLTEMVKQLIAALDEEKGPRKIPAKGRTDSPEA